MRKTPTINAFCERLRFGKAGVVERERDVVLRVVVRLLRPPDFLLLVDRVDFRFAMIRKQPDPYGVGW